MSSQSTSSKKSASEAANKTDHAEGGPVELKFRIPNPTMYMERQSRWIGRRGKPRCDHCRLNNLKCDRVLPSCNHCLWSSGRECTYTPLPTPAHRGIPRCDACRLKNLKCDRNLPTCNYCMEEGDAPCNYTPKRRNRLDHKESSSNSSASESRYSPFVNMDSTGSAPVSAMVLPTHSNSLYSHPGLSHMPSSPAEGPHRRDSKTAHMFYGQNVASSSRSNELAPSSKLLATDGPHSASGRQYSRAVPGVLVHTDLAQASKPSIRRSTSSSKPNRFEPWNSPLFSPLPSELTLRLALLNPQEYPQRTAFDEALRLFTADLSPILQATATFSPDVYSAVAKCLSKGDLSSVADSIRLWALNHRAYSGSDSRALIILPTEDCFMLSHQDQERKRDNYATQTDAEYSDSHQSSRTSSSGSSSLKLFQRFPVQDQIFDILVSAHMGHVDSFTMLDYIRSLQIVGLTWPMAEIFIRLCPSCTSQRAMPSGPLRSSTSP